MSTPIIEKQLPKCRAEHRWKREGQEKVCAGCGMRRRGSTTVLRFLKDGGVK